MAGLDVDESDVVTYLASYDVSVRIIRIDLPDAVSSFIDAAERCRSLRHAVDYFDRLDPDLSAAVPHELLLHIVPEREVEGRIDAVHNIFSRRDFLVYHYRLHREEIEVVGKAAARDIVFDVSFDDVLTCPYVLVSPRVVRALVEEPALAACDLAVFCIYAVLSRCRDCPREGSVAVRHVSKRRFFLSLIVDELDLLQAFRILLHSVLRSVRKYERSLHQVAGDDPVEVLVAVVDGPCIYSELRSVRVSFYIRCLGVSYDRYSRLVVCS